MRPLLVITMFSCLTVNYAAVVVMMAPCPDGHKVGETWYLPDCERCTCEIEENYACHSCSPYTTFYNHTTCYAKTNASANYPDCCTPSVYCKGDADFDPANLNLGNSSQ